MLGAIRTLILVCIYIQGISDSTGKGSESSHCTPLSCDEHEEHDHDQHNAMNDALKRGFPMSADRHEMIALRFHQKSDTVNVDLKSSDHHRGGSSNAHMTCRAGESQEPDQEGDLAALDENLSRSQLMTPHEKLQVTINSFLTDLYGKHEDL